MTTPRADLAATIAPPWISPRRAAEQPRPAALQPSVPPMTGRTLAELEQRAIRPTPAPMPVTTAPAPAPMPAARPSTASGPVQLACRGLFKSYRKGEIGIPVLQGVDLDVHEGEFVAIIGPSGCGKSTLLHLLGTLDAPDAGEVHYGGHRIDNLPTSSRDMIRNRHIGMIFQFYHLLPELSALENILAPALIAEGTLSYFFRRGKHRRRALELMELLGIAHRAKHKPREMSGGEMQRAAIGRALLARPKVLLADEPTGNLDSKAGESLMQLLGELHAAGMTVCIATHDERWIAQAPRHVRLLDGRVASVD